MFVTLANSLTLDQVQCRTSLLSVTNDCAMRDPLTFEWTMGVFRVALGKISQNGASRRTLGTETDLESRDKRQQLLDIVIKLDRLLYINLGLYIVHLKLLRNHNCNEGDGRLLPAAWRHMRARMPVTV